MKIGIIGFGRFGRLAASILKDKGEILIYDKKPDKAFAKKVNARVTELPKVSACDLVILSVPIRDTEALIKKITGYVKPGALIVDTCSVKYYPCMWLKEYLPKSVSILGTHPMFGPDSAGFDPGQLTYELKGLQIVLCPIRLDEDKLEKTEKFLLKAGLDVIKTTPREHDKQNALTLSFVHFIGRSLWASGMREQAICTPGYKDLLKIYRSTSNDSWELFYDMSTYNPYAGGVRQRFISACHRIEEKVELKELENNIESFRALVDKADAELIQVLNKRFSLVSAISKIKSRSKLPVVDKSREERIIGQAKKRFAFDKDFIEGLYRLIFTQSYSIIRKKRKR